MRKYLITVATEMDGHAGSESYYLQSDNPVTMSQIVNAIFSKEIDDREYVEHSKTDARVYGEVYGMPFALTVTILPSRMTKLKLYFTESRTG